jgi:O-antigen/teichoic acid export membrane protein
MLIGIIMTPYYISQLGPEAYGLVAFFTMLTVWMNVLDLGISPTLSREVAAARVKHNGMYEFRKLLRSFEVIFLCISLFISIGFFVLRGFIASEWVKAVELPYNVVIQCIMIFGSLVSLRWFSSLYRSLISGLEEHLLLNTINFISSTLKFVGVLLVFKYIGTDIFVFFLYQLILGILEFVSLIFFSYRFLPDDNPRLPLFAFYWENVRNVFSFALGIAYTSTIWMFVSQVDKLVLSGVLNLKEFGFFNLVIAVSSTITALSYPIIQAIQPRLIYLYSSNKFDEMIQLYKSTTQIVTLVSLSLSIVIALFSKQIIYTWTGNTEASIWCEDVLIWYSLGSGVLAVIGFQYYLQVAIGDLSLHVKGGTLSLFIDVPIIIFVSYYYGAASVGLVWFILRAGWFLLWTALVHKKYLPGFHSNWLFYDVFVIIIPMFLTGVILKSYFILDEFDRFRIFLKVVIIGLMVFSSGALFSSVFRGFILKKFKFKY